MARGLYVTTKRNDKADRSRREIRRLQDARHRGLITAVVMKHPTMRGIETETLETAVIRRGGEMVEVGVIVVGVVIVVDPGAITHIRSNAGFWNVRGWSINKDTDNHNVRSLCVRELNLDIYWHSRDAPDK